MTRGGVSKATRQLHISEDVFGGYNHCLRGGDIKYRCAFLTEGEVGEGGGRWCGGGHRGGGRELRLPPFRFLVLISDPPAPPPPSRRQLDARSEYISVGKGRDMGFDSINAFEIKICGAGPRGWGSGGAGAGTGRGRGRGPPLACPLLLGPLPLLGAGILDLSVAPFCSDFQPFCLPQTPQNTQK